MPETPERPQESNLRDDIHLRWDDLVNTDQTDFMRLALGESPESVALYEFDPTAPSRWEDDDE